MYLNYEDRRIAHARTASRKSNTLGKGILREHLEIQLCLCLHINEDHSVNVWCQGPPVFHIHGELHHHGGPLAPALDHFPIYAELYIYDSQTALEHCCHQNSGLDTDVLQKLQEMLLEHHQYSHSLVNEAPK